VFASVPFALNVHRGYLCHLPGATDRASFSISPFLAGSDA
jgi:hypothetical protein